MERGFLFDENMTPALIGFLGQVDPPIPHFYVGDGFAPPKGTKDPEILDWISDHHCWLVTNNRRSMPVHLTDHITAGKSIMGIFQIPRALSIPQVIADLELVWHLAEPDEFKNQIVYLPLQN